VQLNIFALFPASPYFARLQRSAAAVCGATQRISADIRLDCVVFVLPFALLLCHGWMPPAANLPAVAAHCLRASRNVPYLLHLYLLIPAFASLSACSSPLLPTVTPFVACSTCTVCHLHHHYSACYCRLVPFCHLPAASSVTWNGTISACLGAGPVVFCLLPEEAFSDTASPPLRRACPSRMAASLYVTALTLCQRVPCRACLYLPAIIHCMDSAAVACHNVPLRCMPYRNSVRGRIRLPHVRICFLLRHALDYRMPYYIPHVNIAFTPFVGLDALLNCLMDSSALTITSVAV
jgi:hypothetical protein